MPDLTFEIASAEPKPNTVIPTLVFKTKIFNASENERIYAIALRCQITIEASLRAYNQEAKERLSELFGEPKAWSQTARRIIWTNVTSLVPDFEKEIMFDLAVPCTYDFEVTAVKYFNAVQEGSIPLSFLFNGTVWYLGPSNALQLVQIPWDKESSFHLPISVWRLLIESYYPNSAFIRIHKDTLDRLDKFRANNAITSFDNCLDRLLDLASEGKPV